MTDHMSDARERLIKHMANRFLGWKLPTNFSPDGGISFDPISNKGYVFESRREPVGTNLLDATQAAEMVRYMLEGFSDPAIMGGAGMARPKCPVCLDTGVLPSTLQYPPPPTQTCPQGCRPTQQTPLLPSTQTPDEPRGREVECHGLDTPTQVLFYEQDFYPLSNFSAFKLDYNGERFSTSEEAYHWQRFIGGGETHEHHRMLRLCHSAHAAFRYAQMCKKWQRPDWDAVKVETMRAILRAKVKQHEYVRRKLLATGDRTLIENSWRDDFWGWGPTRDGQNMLGKLWMEIRAELRAATEPSTGDASSPATSSGDK